MDYVFTLRDTKAHPIQTGAAPAWRASARRTKERPRVEHAQKHALQVSHNKLGRATRGARIDDCDHTGYLYCVHMGPIALIAIILAIVLWIIALVSIKDTKQGSAVSLSIWALIVTGFPLVGAISWFAVGKHIATTRH